MTDPFRATIDHEAMLDIAEMLEGDVWNAATLDTIAAIVRAAGYPIRAQYLIIMDVKQDSAS